MAGQRLLHGFDLGMLIELIRLPEVNLIRWSTGSYLFALVFFLYMLFVMGGILQTYREDRPLTAGEFFNASGTFFWRFVRLLLLSIIPFAIAGSVYQALSKAADKIGDRSIADQTGIFLSLVALVVFVLLALSVRLWFDVAQVRAVVCNERGMWRNTWHAFSLTRRNFGSLLGTYVAITLLGWIFMAICLMVWAHLGSTATPAIFVALELIILSQLATRLWQLGSATTWFLGQAEAVPADTVVYPNAAAVDFISAEPAQADLGPDLPAADA